MKSAIFYNADPNSPTTVSTDENTEIIEYFSQNNTKENSLEPSECKRVSLVGADIICGGPPWQELKIGIKLE